jgi:hypothetical protein
VQQDPYQQFASSYVALGGDPVNMIDPSGGWSVANILGITRLGVVGVGAVVGALIGGGAGMANGDDKGFAKGAIIGAFAGLSASFMGGGASAIGQPVLKAVIGTADLIVRKVVENAMPTLMPRPAVVTNTGVSLNTPSYSLDNISDDDSNESEIEKKVSEALDGSNEGFFKALRLIVDNYPEINGGLKEGVDYYVSEGQVPEKLESGAFATESLEMSQWKPNKRIYLSISRNPFDNTCGSKKFFPILVRQIFHEFVHIKLLIGVFLKFGKISATRFTQGNYIHEVIAFYQFLSIKTLPKVIDKTFNKKMAQYAIDNYWNNLTKENKAKYKSMGDYLKKQAGVK